MTRRSAVAFFSTVAGVLAADQASKAIIRALLAPGQSVPVISGIFSLTHVRNEGAAFGILQGGVPFFIVTSIVVLAAILVVLVRGHVKDGLMVIALGLAFGGAAGNLIDRAAAGRVTDFLDFHVWPVFNVADIALDVGVALIVFSILFRPQGAQEASEDGKQAA